MIEKPKPNDREDHREQDKIEPDTAPSDPPDGNTVPSDI